MHRTYSTWYSTVQYSTHSVPGTVQYYLPVATVRVQEVRTGTAGDTSKTTSTTTHMVPVRYVPTHHIQSSSITTLKMLTYHRCCLSLILVLSSFSSITAWMPYAQVTQFHRFEKMNSLQSRAGDTGETMEVPFATIIGNGRIGSTLAKAGNCAVIGRDGSIDESGEGPILIATRNDALDKIIEKCPDCRKPDLVFLQNGYLTTFLKERGLVDNTQVLLYLV